MATTKKNVGIAADILSAYDKLIATIPGIARKGDTLPYTSLNGHMFSYFSKDGNFVLKLPPAEMEAFLKKHKTTLNEAYGIIQKEFAVVPGKLFKNTKELQPYFKMSYDYIKSLNPKPTKKTAKK